MITGAPIKSAARGLLNWSVADLAARCSVTRFTIQRLEQHDGVRPVDLRPLSYKRAFEENGVEFIGTPDHDPGSACDLTDPRSGFEKIFRKFASRALRIQVAIIGSLLMRRLQQAGEEETDMSAKRNHRGPSEDVTHHPSGRADVPQRTSGRQRGPAPPTCGWDACPCSAGCGGLPPRSCPARSSFSPICIGFGAVLAGAVQTAPSGAPRELRQPSPAGPEKKLCSCCVHPFASASIPAESRTMPACRPFKEEC